MGVLANTKQFLARKATETAKKAADGLAAASALSPKQLETIEQKRKEYLSQKPDMGSEAVADIISKNLGAVGIEVYQAYLKQLKNVYRPVNTAIGNFDELNRIRYFDISKWVTDSEEKSLDRLVNVYQVLSEEDCNIALIYHRTKEKCKVVLGVVNTDALQPDPSKVKTYETRLASALKGNFPGVELRTNGGKRDSYGVGIPEELKSVIRNNSTETDVKSVAIVSNLASEKSEDFISQSMEKLLDGIVPQNQSDEYTVVLLAKPIRNQLESKNRLFELYSALAPYASWQTNYTYTTSDAINASSNFGVNLGVSAGIQSSVAEAAGTNIPRLNQDKNAAEKNKVGFWRGIGNIGKQAVGMYAPIQDTQTTTETNGYQANANFGISFARSSSVTAQIGLHEGITQSYSNYGVVHTLEIIENQIKRIEESAALGMWEFASYIISENPVVANNVAHMYLALTQGEESYVTNAAVNLWDGQEERDGAQTILANVQKLQHPVFGLKESVDDEWLMYPTLVTPSTMLSGKELAKSLNFPRKSVSGLPVLQSASFGREVQRFSDNDKRSDRTIAVGRVYHMRRDEEAAVSLDVDSLASHVFITGSTGTGKSNAIYQMISALRNISVKYLVVEPAKGEYKKVFGGSAKVYGTNITKTDLLKLNPFSFPGDIHVLEHIDRIVEIFNACWPMYAAMPAILKDAIEKSYERVGWNLRDSLCEPLTFPTFIDLIETLPEVLNSSLYSSDTKSDYAGALITRVQSLTNGINGQIFCSGAELSGEELFEQNVIVDLSRVGASETKSLLMGIIVMKLQEYRLHLEKMNEKLEHVTILEEAHNLLRKTSVAQSQEGANLQGKAVEMLTNAIAEMRTYGEGFIIADQAPTLLDEAVIRNTNTKIVLRLPDESDRELVGASMALADAQKLELAKLPRGVATIYQNDWVEAVLCHFEEYKDAVPFKYQYHANCKMICRFMKKVFDVKDNYEIKSEDADIIREWVRSLKVSARTKNILCSVIEGNKAGSEEKEIVAYNVFGGKKIAALMADESDRNKGIDMVNRRIQSQLGMKDAELIDSIRQLIFHVIFSSNQEGELARRYRNVEEGRIK